MSKKSTDIGVGKKVLASALSAAMVVAFAPAVALADVAGGSDVAAYSDDTETIEADYIVTNENGLRSAIDKASDGQKIALASNIVLSQCLDINKKVTLDLGNYVLSENIQGDYENKRAIKLTSGADVTIEAANGGVAAECMAVHVSDGAKLTINGGVFTASYAVATFSSSDKKAEVEINGGVFNGWLYTNGKGHDDHFTINNGTFNKQLYFASGDQSTYTITGGVFNTGNETAIEIDGGLLNITGGEFSCSASTAANASKPATNNNGSGAYNGVIVVCKPDGSSKTGYIGDAVVNITGGVFKHTDANAEAIVVADFGSEDVDKGAGDAKVTISGDAEVTGKVVMYKSEGNTGASLSVAGGTFSDFSVLGYTDGSSDIIVRPQQDLMLSKSVSIKNGEKVTVDLGEGKAISATSMPFRLLHGKLSFIGKGTVYESEDDQFGAVVVKGSENQSDTDYSVLSVGENVMLRGWSGIFIDQNKGKAYGVKVTLDGKAANPGMDGHSAAGNGIYLNGQVTDSVNCPVITVGKTAEVTARGDGIYAAGYGKWSISGKVSGSESGMEIRAGELNVIGGEFESTASSFSCDPNGNGSTTVGAALAIAQHTTKKDISIKVADGKFKGLKALNESNPQENDPAPQVTLSVSGGEFDGDVTVVDAQKFITGGKFSTDPTEYVADGYVVSGSGPYTVSKYVAPVTPVDPTPTPAPEPAAPGTNVSGTDAAGNKVEATVTDNNKTTLPDGTEAAGSVEYKGTTSGSGSSEPASSADIPSSVTSSDGTVYAVTKIADDAFNGQEQLTKVTIPATVVEIGARAFANTSISSVVIPAATTTIGAGVFQGCDDLESVDISKAALTSIPEDAFNGAAITSIDIPGSVKSVGARAFKGTALKSVELPAATTTLGTAAFQGCASLKSADISEAALTEIPAYAFNGTSITSIDIPDTVKTIGKRAFKKTKLKTVSTDAEVLKRGAFSGCASLKSASLPEVTEIGEYAFYGNDALKTLTTGADLEAIGPRAFKGAGKFKVLRISSKRLAKYTVEDSLKGSAVTRVEVAVPGSAKTVQKFVKRYSKLFAKANSGKSVEVTKTKKASKK